jgi:hypothetical protein
MSRGNEVEVSHVSKKPEVTLKSGKSHLHILGIQSTIAWENPEANWLHFEKQIREGVQKTPETDVVVIPDVFTFHDEPFQDRFLGIQRDTSFLYNFFDLPRAHIEFLHTTAPSYV